MHAQQAWRVAQLFRVISARTAAFCTRLSKVAADAVVQKAMRHSSPETKRLYQLGMVEEVGEAMDEANEKFYGGLEYHILSTVTSVEPQRIKEEGLQVVDA